MRERDILRKVSLMNIYYMPGTVLATRDRTVSKLLSSRKDIKPTIIYIQLWGTRIGVMGINDEGWGKLLLGNEVYAKI